MMGRQGIPAASCDLGLTVWPYRPILIFGFRLAVVFGRFRCLGRSSLTRGRTSLGVGFQS